MKKFVSMLILVMLLVGLVLSSSATTVTGEIYVDALTEVLSEPNADMPKGAPVSPNDTTPKGEVLPNDATPKGEPALPKTGGIPMFAFMGTGVLLIVIAIVISSKKQKTAK